MDFDFSNTSEQGYAILPPARYPVETGEWWVSRSEAGNPVLQINTKVLDGQFKGETPRYFHTILDTEKSKGYFLKLLRNLSIIVDGDRGEDGVLKASFVYGDKDDDGRVRIAAIEVNGEERPVEGCPAIAVVVKREDDPEKTKIKQLDPATTSSEDSSPAGDKPKATTSGSSKKGKIPF